MTYTDMPVIIPLLATGYLLAIYLLLILAQRTVKGERSPGDSLEEANLREKLLPTQDAIPYITLPYGKSFAQQEPLRGTETSIVNGKL